MGRNFFVKICVALVLGVLAGFWIGDTAAFHLFDLIGRLFINALTLIVVPLVASSIITGIAKLSKEDSFKEAGTKTLCFFVLTLILALFVGGVFFYLFSPMFASSQILVASQQPVLDGEMGLFARFSELALQFVPSNILAVAASGQMLGLILFTGIFGFFVSKLPKGIGDVQGRFWEGVFLIMMRMTSLVMYVMPLAVFAMMAKVVAQTGLEAVYPVLFFFLSVVSALMVYAFAFLPLLLKVAGISPMQHMRAVLPALATAFSTSSSAATLPITLECMEERAHVPNRLCGFVLPIATTLNLSGSALFALMAAFFIATLSGITLGFFDVAIVVILSLFTGFGMVAGVPSGSLVALVITLKAVGIASDGVVLLMAVERVLDMARTTVNVLSNTCCLALVNRKR